MLSAKPRSGSPVGVRPTWRAAQRLDFSTMADPRHLDCYSEMLKVSLHDGKVEKTELEMLKVYRRHNKISDEDHSTLLTKIGFTPEHWKSAIHEADHHEHESHWGTDHEFPSKPYTHKDYPHAFPAYVFNIIAPPRLRQFYERSKDKEILAFWREKEERKASWTELFFDLVFVAYIFKLGKDADLYFPSFILTYYSMWVLWTSITGYASRYEPAHKEWTHPLFYFAVMTTTCFMSVSVDEIYYNSIPGMQAFCLSYGLALTFIMLFYIWAAVDEYLNRHDGSRLGHREYNTHPLCMSALFAVCIIPWIICYGLAKKNYELSTEVSLITPIQMEIVWAFALLMLDWGTYVVNYFHHYSAPICIDHWGERIALFTMIHLGEAIFGITAEFVNRGLLRYRYILAFVGAAMGLMIVWVIRRIYFDVELGEAKRVHALRRTRWSPYVWNFAHLVMCASIISFAVGIQALQKLTIKGLDAEFNSSFLLQNETDPIIIENITHYLEKQLAKIDKETFGPSWIFSCGIALTVVSIGVQSALSIPNTDRYRCPHSNWIRFGMRVCMFLFCVLIPLAKLPSFNLINTVGCASALWGIAESVTLFKKSAHGGRAHHEGSLDVGHHPTSGINPQLYEKLVD